MGQQADEYLRRQIGTQSASGLKHVTAGFPPALRPDGKSDRCFLCSGPLNGNTIPICTDCEAEAKREAQERIACEVEGRREAEGRRLANLHNELSSIGFALEHARADLTEHPKAVRAVVAGFMERPEAARGLLICGPVGTGKTHLLAAVCREYLVKRASVRFCLARALFRRVRSTYQDTATEHEQQVIDDLASCDLLAVDDLGHEGRVTDSSVGILHEVISYRHGDFKPTVITTNLSPDQIVQRYSQAIGSRLGAWARVVLAGKDLRA